jgi:hypothetical protein
MPEYILPIRQHTALRNQAQQENLPKEHPVMMLLGMAKWFGGMQVYVLPPTAEAETAFVECCKRAGFTPAQTP